MPGRKFANILLGIATLASSGDGSFLQRQEELAIYNLNQRLDLLKIDIDRLATNRDGTERRLDGIVNGLDKLKIDVRGIGIRLNNLADDLGSIKLQVEGLKKAVEDRYLTEKLGGKPDYSTDY